MGLNKRWSEIQVLVPTLPANLQPTPVVHSRLLTQQGFRWSSLTKRFSVFTPAQHSSQ